MGFAPPDPSYLKFGCLTFDYEQDMCKGQALVAIEHDAGFCRIDELQGVDQIGERLSSGQGLLNSYQLTDSYMRNIAFKMEKLDKFGA